MQRLRAALLCTLLACGTAAVRSAPAEENGNGKEEEKPREHMKDNSFLVEEAYNQEQGVVRRIFDWVGQWNQHQGQSRQFTFLYSLEMPLGSEMHQFSFVVPMLQFVNIPDSGLSEEQGGLGDIFLNYRYQLFKDEKDRWTPAVAPRFTTILPTGDKTRDLGNGEFGYLFNLPISKQLEPFAFHFNAGLAFIPQANVQLADGTFSPKKNLRGYNLGASIIWLASYDVNFLLECVSFWNEEFDDGGFRQGTNQVILNPGVRWAVYTEGDLQWVLGVSVPIGLTSDAPDIGVFGYMSIEHRAKKEKKKNGD